MLKKVVFLAVTSVSAFALHTAELNINDKDLELGVQFDIGQFNDNVEPGTMFLGAKFFKPDEDHSTENISTIEPYYEANFLVMRELGKSRFSLGMGVKFNYTSFVDTTFMTLPLGLEGSYKIPAGDLIPMSIKGSFYYAPEVLGLSSDAKDYLEYKIYYDAELIENAGLTIGYRNMNMKFNGTNRLNYNSSWYFGFKIKF